MLVQNKSRRRNVMNRIENAMAALKEKGRSSGYGEDKGDHKGAGGGRDRRY